MTLLDAGDACDRNWNGEVSRSPMPPNHLHELDKVTVTHEQRSGIESTVHMTSAEFQQLLAAVSQRGTASPGQGGSNSATFDLEVLLI